MKRVIAAVLIIAFSLGFSVWANIKIDNTLEEILCTVENDGESVFSLWQNKKTFLSLFLMHDDVDSLDEEISAMKKYAQADRQEDVQDCRVRIEGYIESVRQGEKLSFANVF